MRTNFQGHPTPEADRFWAKVKKTDGCWEWLGYIRPDGYAWFTTGYAHRWIAKHILGIVTDHRMVVDHSCNNRACVNPEHLRVVSQRENVLRGAGVAARNAEKTTCKNGHPYEGDNVYVRPDGCRDCRACHRKRQQSINERNRRG